MKYILCILKFHHSTQFISSTVMTHAPFLIYIDLSKFIKTQLFWYKMDLIDMEMMKHRLALQSNANTSSNHNNYN